MTDPKDACIDYLGARLPVTRAAAKAVLNLLPEAMEATGFTFGDASTAIEVDPVVEFMNAASGDDIDAIEGFGAVTVGHVIDARPHTLDSLQTLLSDAQMAAARAILG